MHVLIVDDSKAMRMIVTRALRQAGIEATPHYAENGRHALEVLADTPDISVILSDWNMDEMGGLDLLTTLRGRGDERPLVFVTSEHTEAVREQARQAGAHAVITKPFNANSLHDALAPLMRK
jgi:two-component system chemotaxis response regulator CheY